MNRGTYRLLALGLVPIVALLVMIGTAGAAPKGGLTVNLKVAQSEFRASQDVIVTVTLSNPTKQPAHILKWFTPADGVDESLFTVTRDGQPVAYTGARVKRPAATDGDYLVLEPGASVSSVVDLGDFYDFTGTGRYEISYNVSAYDLFGKNSTVSRPKDTLTSATISLKVAGRAAKGKPQPPPPPPPNPDGNIFRACSTAQQSALNVARTNAKQYAANAASYLTTGSQGLRYTTWFGVVGTTGRYGTVKSHFSAISGAMQTAPITFDCSSKRKVYAYVYPDDPFKIYLGSVYWSAPALGTDSQAGTLIHEMSHFTNVAGTDDVVYGQAGAKSLAISNPDAAITNADSHEYFAENTPEQN
jgi:peptidyl-Lys metalloendopeptidase